MTLRCIQWIADSGLLVGLTTIGEFPPLPALTALSLSSGSFTLGMPATSPILGATSGSTLTAIGLPAGLTLSAGPEWTYDGTGTPGSYSFQLTETLSGSSNSPHTTGIAIVIATPNATFDFSQSASSGLVAALRSF